MRKMIALVLSIFLIFLLCISNPTQAITISMGVDSNEKSVLPGDTVFFLWTIGNEDDIYTIDFHISSEPETIFNPTDFTLGPGEEQLVNQTVKTLKSDENGTIYDIEVILTGEYYMIQPIPGFPNEIGPVASRVIVTILNGSNESIEAEQLKHYQSSDDYGITLGIISMIVLAVVIIIIYIRWKKD